MKKRVIICGYFSLEYKTNTVGDLIVLSTLTDWLDELNIEYDVASNFLGSGSRAISLDNVIVDDYDAMIFVCGPLADFDPLISFIERFKAIKRIAINVSIIDDHSKIVELFDCIIPRDTCNITNFDMAIEKSITKYVPVVGLIFVGPQIEYAEQKHSSVEDTVISVLNELGYAIIRIDTKVPYNEYELKDQYQIISAITKMDIVITTRLHGSILSLKAHTPFIAIDPISKGAKVTKQVGKIGWPYLINVDDLTPDNLKRLIQRALSSESKSLTYDIENKCLELYKNNRDSMLSKLKEALYE